jgi:hypothetical protein
MIRAAVVVTGLLLSACAMESRGLQQVRVDAGFDASSLAVLAPLAPTLPDAVALAVVAPAEGGSAPDAGDPAPAMWDAASDLAAPAPDAGVTLERGLLLYLRFDDAPGAAVARDDSGLNQQALLHQLDATRSWVAGRVGGALSLNGGTAGGWVSVEDAATLNRAADELTLTAWLYPSETSAGTVAARASGTPGGYLYLVEVASDGHLHVTLHGSQASAVLDGPGVVKNRWTHVAVTAGRGQVRIFINGVAQLAQQYRAGVATDSTPLLLGITEPRAKKNRFAGRLDELALYDRVISDAEVAALARGTRPGGPGY